MQILDLVFVAVVLVVPLSYAVFCAVVCARMAERKGYSVAPWWIAGFFLGIWAIWLLSTLPTLPESLARDRRAERKAPQPEMPVQKSFWP